MFSARYLVCFLFLICSITGLAAKRNLHPLSFSAEDSSVEPFQALPDVAIKAIANDRKYFEEGPATDLKCVNHEDHSEQKAPLQLLCRVLSLSSLSGTDYLAIGVGELRGAHIVPFWVVHVENGKAALLFSTVSDALEITERSHAGYRDIEVIWVMQAGGLIETDTYRFRGGRYRRFSRHEQRN